MIIPPTSSIVTGMESITQINSGFVQCGVFINSITCIVSLGMMWYAHNTLVHNNSICNFMQFVVSSKFFFHPIKYSFIRSYANS